MYSAFRHGNEFQTAGLAMWHRIQGLLYYSIADMKEPA